MCFWHQLDRSLHGVLFPAGHALPRPVHNGEAALRSAGAARGALRRGSSGGATRVPELLRERSKVRTVRTCSSFWGLIPNHLVCVGH